MASIYSKAERIVIWLGPSTEETDLFMDAAAEFSKACLKQEHANWIPHEEHWIYVWKSILNKRLYNKEAVCRGLESLLDRPWFKRIWVLQEVANARIADVVCGSKSIPAKTFVLASQITGVTPNPHCQAVLDIMPGASRNRSWWTQKRDLRTLLAKFGASEASDSRDIIYALLGMSTDACASGFVYPNYEVSLEQAIHNTMLFLLGLHECDRNDLQLPSWSLTNFLSKLDDLSTAIYWSKPSWDVPSIKVLVDMGLDLDAMLHHAVVHGDVQEVRSLIKSGARVNERSKGTETTLNKATLDLFVTDSKGYWDKIRSCDKGETALFRGVRRGDLDIVSLVIENGANINDESNGETALSTAVQTWNEGILSLLIKGGADRSEKFNGATLTSSAKGNMKIVHQLIGTSLDPFRKAVSGLTILHLASMPGRTATLDLLLDAKMYLYERDNEGRTALHMASLAGQQESVKRLLNSGADISLRDRTGMTVLHYAAVGGSVVVVEFLLDNGMSVDERDKEGRTALYMAALAGQQESVKRLLNSGADISLRDRKGSTVLHYAALGESEVVMEFLLECGMSVDERDNEGRTALHIAALAKQHEILKRLLNSGAYISLRDREGETVLHYAAVSGNVVVMKFLLDLDSRMRTVLKEEIMEEERYYIPCGTLARRTWRGKALGIIP
jgi:ankyrin repeat protein